MAYLKGKEKPIYRLPVSYSQRLLRLTAARHEMKQEFRRLPREPAAGECSEVLGIWCLQLPDVFQCTNTKCFHYCYATRVL